MGGDWYVVENSITTGLTQGTAPFDLLTQAVSPGGATLTYTYRRSNEITKYAYQNYNTTRWLHPEGGCINDLDAAIVLDIS